MIMNNNRQTHVSCHDEALGPKFQNPSRIEEVRRILVPRKSILDHTRWQSRYLNSLIRISTWIWIPESKLLGGYGSLNWYCTPLPHFRPSCQMGGHWPVEQVNLDIHRSLFPLLTVHRTRVADPGFKYSGIRIRFSKYDRIRYKTPLKSNLFCSIFFPKSAVSILTFYLPRSDPDKIRIRNPAQFRKPLCVHQKSQCYPILVE